MLRIWSEHLAYVDARRPETLDLLERGRLHPLFAVRPDSPRDELAGLIADVHDRGLEVGIWPLIAKEAGYWPSVRNAERFVAYLDDLLDALDARGVRPDWVAFDIEPPYERDDTFGASIRRGFRRTLGRALFSESDGGGSAFDDAVETYRAAVEALHDAGMRTLGVATPTVAGDVGREMHWQRSLETPWSPLPWERAGIMAYGSMISGYSGGFLDYADVRALHFRLLRRLRRAFGPRTHVSVGVTGIGVYEAEPYYRDPAELARDIGAARAAGIEDIAVFCLEGILEQPRPGAWVDAIAGASAEVPPGRWKADAVLGATAAVSELLALLRRAGR